MEGVSGKFYNLTTEEVPHRRLWTKKSPMNYGKKAST